MSIVFSNKDIEMSKKNALNIIKLAEKRYNDIFNDPLANKAIAVTETVVGFIKSNKRILCGNYALEMLIKNNDTPQISFYTPTPIEDMTKLCNTLYEDKDREKYKNISGKEIFPDKTFCIIVDNLNYCDVIYMPDEIYNKIPTQQIDGFSLISREIMIIDHLMITTNLIENSEYLEKTLDTFPLLLKHCDNLFQSDNKKIKIPPPPDNQKTVKKLMDKVFGYVTENLNCIVVGFYAYNHFVQAAGLKDFVEIPYYEIISPDYKKDTLEIIDRLKSDDKDKDKDKNIKHVEYFPLLTYWGHCTIIYYKTTIIARVFSNNKSCVSYKTVVSMNDMFSGAKVNIGSYSTVMLYNLIACLKGNLDGDSEVKYFYGALVSHMAQLKDTFLAKNNKTILDDTLFQEFSLDFKGTPVLTHMERLNIINMRKKRGDKLVINYDPSQDTDRKITCRFPYITGNEITQSEDLVLTDLFSLKNDANIL